MRKAGALILGQGEPAGVRARRHVESAASAARCSTRTTSRARRAARAAAPAPRSPPTSRCSGTGSDTGQSIRSPASANNLVGIRPTRGLVSRAGVIPNSLTQDEIGPITRTVTDAALLLDVMAGYDPADPITAFGNGRITEELHASAAARTRSRARASASMTNMFGKDERHQEVNKVMEDVIAKMQSLGATIVRFDLPEYDKLASVVATSPLRGAHGDGELLRDARPNAPVKSFADLVAAKNSAVQKTLEAELAVVDGMNSQAYKDRTLNRDKLRLAVATKMADLNLDAILYPLQKILVAPVTAGDQLERNGTLSNGTGFPAVTFPGGFSTPTAIGAARRSGRRRAARARLHGGEAARLRLRIRAGGQAAQAAGEHASPARRTVTPPFPPGSQP